MQFHEMLDDRKPQPETTETSGDRLIGLLESIEDVRKELRTNPDTGVRHGNLGVRSDLAEPHRDLSAFRSELDCVRKQVPDDLLDACRVRRNGTGGAVQLTLDGDALFVRVVLNRIDGVADDRHEV